MNDPLSRVEKLMEQLAEQAVQTNQRLDRLTEKVESLADGQKHTDAKLDALTDIVRQWIERNGKSGNGQKP
jgi:ABC-type transporter Mla subunit MlaD